VGDRPGAADTIEEVSGMGQLRRKRVRGQSTLEYILVFLAVLLAVGVAATQFIQPKASKAIESSSSTLEKASAKLGPGLGL
jgi:uncharacterized protein (UPF0333 family)